MKKILIIGYGICGAYLASRLSECELTIVSDDIRSAGVGGRADKWGKILYHSSSILCRSNRPSSEIFGSAEYLSRVSSTLGINLGLDVGVYWMHADSWFKEIDITLRLRKNIKFENDRLISFDREYLYFEGATCKISDYDSVYIYVNHTSLLRILASSKIISSPIFLGNHISGNWEGPADGTHSLHKSNLIIKRREFLNKDDQIQYLHKIPSAYPNSLKEIAENFSAKRFHIFILYVFLAFRHRWFWQLLKSLFVPMDLTKFSGVSYVTKVDVDVRPDDQQIQYFYDTDDVVYVADGSVGIEHEYGINTENWLRIREHRASNVVLNPSIDLTQLGAANATLPILLMIEYEVSI